MKVKKSLISGDGQKLIKVYEDGTIEDLSYGISGTTAFNRLSLAFVKKGKLIFLNDTNYDSIQSYRRGTNLIVTEIRKDKHKLVLEDYVANNEIFRNIKTTFKEIMIFGESKIDNVEKEIGVLNNKSKKQAEFFSRNKKVYLKYNNSKLKFPYPIQNNSEGIYTQISAIDLLKNNYKRMEWGEYENIGLIFKISFKNQMSLIFSDNLPFKKIGPLKFKNQDLMILQSLTNKETGLTMAAPEWDPDYKISGGYQYVWPRDLYKMSIVFNNCNRFKSLKKIFKQYGNFPHRIWSNTSLAPGWCNGMFYNNPRGIQYDQLGYMALYFLKLKENRLTKLLLTKIFNTSYKNGFCIEGVNMWEDHYGQIFSSTTGVYLQTYVEAAKLDKKFEERAQNLIKNVDLFWNGNYFIMGFIPKYNKSTKFVLKDYFKNSKLDSATSELLRGLVKYQEQFGFDENLTKKIIKHISYVLSKKGLYKDNKNIFGIVRYTKDTWQKNDKIKNYEKIWSVATLEIALIAMEIVKFLKKQKVYNNYSKQVNLFLNFVKKIKKFYSSFENIPEQFYDDGSYSSANPLGWSHALRYELSKQNI